MANAAERLVPYMSTYDCSPASSSDDLNRHIAEQRVKDVISGGTGGWIVRVEDEKLASSSLVDKATEEWNEQARKLATKKKDYRK